MIFEPQKVFPEMNFVALTGDASHRKYWRVLGENQILCHDSQDSSRDEFINLSNCLYLNNCHVPQVLKVDEENKIFFQNDLGDQTFLIKISENIHDKVLIEKLYFKAIDELLKIHSISDIPNFVKNRSFDFEKYSFEINMTLDYFANRLENYSKDIIEQTRLNFNDIIFEIIESPNVFTHRDFHSRNLMIKNDEVYVIDFQDARMGTCYYDLASLLDDCYYQVPEELKDKVLKYYYKQALSVGIIKSSYDEFLKRYYLSVAQRAFKAIGSFAYLYFTKDTTRYLKHIGLAMEKVRTACVETGHSLKILESYYAN